MLQLTDPRVSKLLNLIGDSFRVHQNRPPVYVETANNLERIASPQHQVVYGRRGSGKSCLLVTHHFNAVTENLKSIYVNADDIKNLSHPDMIIRVLIALFQALPRRRGMFWAWRTEAGSILADLRNLLDEATEQDVERHRSTTRRRDTHLAFSDEAIEGGASRGSERTEAVRSQFVARKLDYLERHKPDFRAALSDGIRRISTGHVSFILDDFYAIPIDLQPDIIDYLYGLVRGTDCYLKIGTIRHRSQLMRLAAGRTAGVERQQDFEPIDLDHTFEDVPRTRDILRRMLNSMGEKVGIVEASDELLTSETLLSLTLASGGVPRDFLTILTEALNDAKGQVRLTPTNVYRGAARQSYRTKLQNFREDAGTDFRPLEHLRNDLARFCLVEKRKTAFLISEAEAQADPQGHELIRQLMDLKLIHVIEQDTSAASGRPGRYEAYTLDFTAFMEPRLRGIEHVEFWKRDENSRPRGVREAPIYPLARGRAAAEQIQDALGAAGEESDGQ